MLVAGVALLVLGLVAAVMVGIGSQHDGRDEQDDARAGVEIPGQRGADSSERSLIR